MIKNKRQYNVTKSQISKLRGALVAAQQMENKMQPQVYKAMIDGIEGEIEELSLQIERYKQLPKRSNLYLSSIKKLPEILIEARVIRGYSHKDFATILGWKPQQVQRYEDNNYQSANLSRISKVMDALGIEVEAVIPLNPERDKGRSRSTFILVPETLKQTTGVDMDDINRRLYECEQLPGLVG